MAIKNKTQHDIFVMKEALDIIQKHYEAQILVGDAEQYIDNRLQYLKVGLNDYTAEGILSGSVATSLSDFYSHVLDEKCNDGNLVWSIYRDVADVLRNIAMDA